MEIIYYTISKVLVLRAMATKYTFNLNNKTLLYTFMHTVSHACIQLYILY